MDESVFSEAGIKYQRASYQYSPETKTLLGQYAGLKPKEWSLKTETEYFKRLQKAKEELAKITPCQTNDCQDAEQGNKEGQKRIAELEDTIKSISTTIVFSKINSLIYRAEKEARGNDSRLIAYLHDSIIETYDAVDSYVPKKDGNFSPKFYRTLDEYYDSKEREFSGMALEPHTMKDIKALNSERQKRLCEGADTSIEGIMDRLVDRNIFPKTDSRRIFVEGIRVVDIDEKTIDIDPDDKSLHDESPEERLVNDAIYFPEETYEAVGLQFLNDKLAEVLSTLTERQEKVIRLRFGLDDGYPMTVDEVGNVFNVTRERVRQIEARAMKRLRHPARANLLKSYLE